MLQEELYSFLSYLSIVDTDSKEVADYQLQSARFNPVLTLRSTGSTLEFVVNLPLEGRKMRSTPCILLLCLNIVK
jgi:hypothetical protein